MRNLVVTIVLLVGGIAGATPAKPAAKAKIAILGLEVVTAPKVVPDAETVRVASELTTALRSRAKAGTFVVAPGSDKDLVALKAANHCESEGKACMAKIGADLGAELMIYGKVEKKPNGYQLSLRRFDVAKQAIETAWTDFVPDGSALEDWGRRGFANLTGGCDFPALTKAADTALASGQFAKALAGYEEALVCKADDTLVNKAYMASCRLRNAAKAKAYWKKIVPGKQQALSQLCLSEGIDPRL
ncbi:MAG: hypothetical protein ABI867_39875 [Kofleriaceae bacterium]